MKKINGVVIGIVKSLDDPERQGKIELQFPWLSEVHRSAWAPVAVPMAGKKRGVFYMPELGDEVLVAFEHGDFDHPFIVGYLWNGVDTPPTTDPHRRLMHSVNGHEIEMYDPPISAGDKGYIRFKDAHGNTIQLANGRISITSVSFIEINAPQVVINGRPVALAPGPI
jgi:uncharacterized protein involved in type VI secretion and phage assembly